jgi:DNA-directed RNA polymerase subunit RPC12/RpoP
VAESAYFIQECPTCGRSLHIRVEHLGKRVVCQHCRGQLLAADPSMQRPMSASPQFSLVARADELLESSAPRRNLPR